MIRREGKESETKSGDIDEKTVINKEIRFISFCSENEKSVGVSLLIILRCKSYIEKSLIQSPSRTMICRPLQKSV